MSNSGHVFAFEKLKVWEEIRILIRSIYLLTKIYPDDERFGLVIQMRRAIISVSSNLAEGTSRTSSKDQAHFYQLSYLSLIEVLSQLILSKELVYIDEKRYLEIRSQIEKISYLLNQLRKSALTKPKTQPSKLPKQTTQTSKP